MTTNNDRTITIENQVQLRRKPRFKYLLKLFSYVFSSAKVICCIYLIFFVLLSLLRPILAFIWGQYIHGLENLSTEQTIVSSALLVIIYFLINFLSEIVSDRIISGGTIERFDLVQANHLQELLHSKMYEKLATLSPESYEIPEINDRIERVWEFAGGNVRGLNQSVMIGGYTVIAKIVSVLSIAISLFVFNPLLTLLVIITVLPSFWFLTIGEKLRVKFTLENTALKRRADYFQNMMLFPFAAKEMKTLGLHDFFYDKWKDVADEYVYNEKKIIRSQAILQILNNIVVTSASIGGSIFAIVLMIHGHIGLGTLGAVLSLVSVLVSDFRSLISSFVSFSMRKNEATHFFDLMEYESEDNNGNIVGSLEKISIQNLMYRYPLTDRYIIDSLSLEIRKGEKIAFVGENGTGKTTLIKLIMGMMLPSGGELLINDTPVEKMDLVNYFDGIGAVFQTPARYTTFSVGDNVFLGDSSKLRNEENIEKALSFVGLGDIGKDITLGKDIGGSELSGGQWQKLSLAKAAYRNRDFLILDEPTSNLDPLIETEIFSKFISLSANTTVIYTTHRISAAALADRIVVFLDGKIVQDGSHSNLIKQPGEYARLYNEQARWYDR